MVERFSRRDFFKVAGIGAGAIFLPRDVLQIEWPGEVLQYEARGAEIVERVKHNFGTEFASPKNWEGKQNLRLANEELAILEDAISNLPPSYLSYREASIYPKQVLLIRTPWRWDAPIGGGYYTIGAIRLDVSEAFKTNDFAVGPLGSLFIKQKNYLKSCLTHEWTHSYTAYRPSVLADWIQFTGWKQTKEGAWVNDNPVTLVHYGGADLNPVEDIAVSASLFPINPQLLSRQRMLFFINSPDYAGWKAAEKYFG